VEKAFETVSLQFANNSPKNPEEFVISQGGVILDIV